MRRSAGRLSGGGSFTFWRASDVSWHWLHSVFVDGHDGQGRPSRSGRGRPGWGRRRGAARGRRGTSSPLASRARISSEVATQAILELALEAEVLEVLRRRAGQPGGPGRWGEGLLAEALAEPVHLGARGRAVRRAPSAPGRAARAPEAPAPARPGARRGRRATDRARSPPPLEQTVPREQLVELGRGQLAALSLRSRERARGAARCGGRRAARAATPAWRPAGPRATRAARCSSCVNRPRGVARVGAWAVRRRGAIRSATVGAGDSLPAARGRVGGRSCAGGETAGPGGRREQGRRCPATPSDPSGDPRAQAAPRRGRSTRALPERGGVRRGPARQVHDGEGSSGRTGLASVTARTRKSSASDTVDSASRTARGRGRGSGAPTEVGDRDRHGGRARRQAGVCVPRTP